MAKATVKGYGKVDFDPMCYGNNTIDLYDIAVCDYTDDIVDVERYTDEADYRAALSEYQMLDEQEEIKELDVTFNMDGYLVEATIHTAYVYMYGTVTINGDMCHIDDAVELMDDELREQVHADGIEIPQDFIDAYCKLHAERYGEQFTI